MNEKVTRMRLGEGPENADAELTRLREMSDHDIDCSDIPELDAQWFKQAMAFSICYLAKVRGKHQDCRL